MGSIKLVRIYDHVQPAGYRILVDRVWPRGISKVRANLDLWEKEIAPTNQLRKWFNHEDDKYPQFKSDYDKQLDDNPNTPAFLKMVKQQLIKQDVLFLYGAKNIKHNQAVVLKAYVENH